MGFLASFIKKRPSAMLVLQILFVALAFALLVVSSYFFVAGIEREHLANDAQSALSYTQARIEGDLGQAAIMAAGISYTIRDMILEGATLSDVQKHLKEMDDYANSSKITGFDGFFGYFDVYGGVNVNAAGRYLPPGVAAESRPWYIAAEEAEGKAAVTQPYFSLNTNNLVLTYVQRIYDGHGKPLGITCMNITFDGIARHIKHITDIAHKNGTFGVLHDMNSMILIHPNKNLIGQKMSDINSGVGKLSDELAQHGEIAEREVINNDGNKVIVFFKSMNNGWQIGVQTLKGQYYRNLRVMAIFLGSLGTLLTCILSYILVGITRAKRRADEFTQIVFDAMPLACDLWDSDRKNVMCNEEAVRLYGARGKQDYLDKYFDFSPEYQPCGRRSRELSVEMIDKAFTEGYARVEWMYKTWDGRPLPCEVTLVRIMYKGDLSVLAYKRDLREEKASLDRIREADERAHAMFDAAPVGINMWDINGNLIDCNMESARVTGVSSKQEYIDSFQRLMPEYQSDGRKSSAVFMEAHITTFKEGYCRLTWEHHTVDGEIVPFDMTCVRLKYKDGFVGVSYARDLREIRAEMQKTQEANERIQSILDITPLAITVWDPASGTIIDCNMEAVRLVGLSDKKTYMERFNDMAPEYQADGQKTSEKIVTVIDKAMREGVSRYDWDHMNVNGEVIPFYVSTFSLKHLDGHIIISYAQDMRDINSAIAKMRETDEFTQVMFKAMPLACQLWNKELQCVMCNDEAIHVYGVTDRQFFLDNFFNYSPECQPCGKPSKEMGQDYLRQGFEEGYVRFEWMHKKGGDGEDFPCEITIIRATFNGEPALLTYTRDLSEEKAAMQKLREADERTIMMLDAAPIGVTLWDSGINLIDFNYEAARVVGIHNKPEYREMFGKLTPEFQPDGRKSKDVLLKFFDDTYKNGQSHILWYHNTIDGEGVPFDATAIRLKLKYKDEDVVMVCCRDLREIYAANAESREAEERMQIMFNSMPLCANFRTRDMGIIDCNEEGIRLFGFGNKEEYIRDYLKVYPEYQPDGRLSAETAKELIDKGFEEGFMRFEWTYQALNGDLIPSEVTFVRVGYRDGFVLATYIRDLREQKAMINEMQKAEIAEERAQILLDAAPVGCVLYDNAQNAVDCNPEALKLFGISDKKQFLTSGVRAFSPEYQPDGRLSDEKINEVTFLAFDNGHHRFEWMHTNAAGEEVPCEVTLLRVKYKDKYVIASYMRDLREYKAMMAEKHKAEVAEDSNKAKGRFLAAMSHEIRTPMNVILGVTEIQLQDDSLQPYLREAFLQIYNSSILLLGIINDILDLSKIEAGKMELTPAPYKLASLVNDTVHLNMMRNSKPIEFELAIDENSPANLYGDELRIKQILNNLLSNAFKFTGKGTIKLSVSVDEIGGATEDDVKLVFTVSDTGQGMTDEQLNSLFSEYTRFNLDSNRAIEGTGLGMNITRDLVSMMDGEIDVDSAFGKGTIIKVRLPQKRMNSERIGHELAENMRQFRVNATSPLTKNQPITREYMPYGRVLIVDDVESNLYVAKGLMAPYGLAVDTVSSGVKAVEKVTSGEIYDVIFMDHMMPGMDGLEAAKHIREYGYKNPIVALTANAVVGQAEMFMNSGFDDFISKPIDIRQLNTTLNKLVRDRQPPEVVENARNEKEKMTKTNPNYSNAVVSHELLAIFARDANRVMPAIEALLKNADKASSDTFHLFTVSVHAMKSALANIGETRLSQMALTLEQAGKAKNGNTITMQLPSFIKALREITAKAEADSKIKNAAAENENPEILREQLKIISKACAQYDERTVDEALDHLKTMKWTAETEEALDKISQLLLHSDFEEAAQFAASVIGKIEA